MKTRLLPLLFAALFPVLAYCQFGVGMRDNRYVYADYTFCRHFNVKVEQSVYAEKIGFQYLRAYAGYRNSVAGIDYGVQGYFGAAYNGSYHSGGAMAKARYKVLERIIIDASLNPHYDSEYGYNTCYSIGAGVVITKNIDIVGEYSTIPQYRMPEKRLNGGFDFHVRSLSVMPRLSIDVAGTSRFKTLRALMGFRYQF